MYCYRIPSNKAHASAFIFRYPLFTMQELPGRSIPTPDVIQHVDATLKLLSVLTNDTRFETVAKGLDREKKGVITMCTIVDQFEEKGRAEGFVQGKRQGMFGANWRV